MYLGNIPEYILSLLDAKSLTSCVRVCKSWKQAVAHGMLWRKLIERKIRTDPIWQGLSERRGWLVSSSIFKNTLYVLPLSGRNSYSRVKNKLLI